MNDPLIVVAWMLGDALVFGLVGALFGGLAGWLHARDGHAGGTRWGRRVAAALGRLFNETLNLEQQGALVGAVDGAIFLGISGLVLGLLAVRFAPQPWDWVLPTFTVALLLIMGAIFFGVLALGLRRLQLRAALGLSLGGAVGGAVAAWTWGVVHIVPGVVVGILIGTLLAILAAGRS